VKVAAYGNLRACRVASRVVLNRETAQEHLEPLLDSLEAVSCQSSSQCAVTSCYIDPHTAPQAACSKGNSRSTDEGITREHMVL
jgi:hypothetical protein